MVVVEAVEVAGGVEVEEDCATARAAPVIRRRVVGSIFGDRGGFKFFWVWRKEI